jgi:hypothetical protein
MLHKLFDAIESSIKITRYIGNTGMKSEGFRVRFPNDFNIKGRNGSKNWCSFISIVVSEKSSFYLQINPGQFVFWLFTSFQRIDNVIAEGGYNKVALLSGYIVVSINFPEYSSEYLFLNNMIPNQKDIEVEYCLDIDIFTDLPPPNFDEWEGSYEPFYIYKTYSTGTKSKLC